MPRPQLSSSDWNLSINKVTEEDDGLYECQVNTEPKINYKVFLTVKGDIDFIYKEVLQYLF